jgi:hypothetical protein
LRIAIDKPKNPLNPQKEISDYFQFFEDLLLTSPKKCRGTFAGWLAG